MNLPHSVETETQLLGAIIINGKNIEQVSLLLKPEDFYAASNQYIYSAMLNMREQSIPVDIVTLRNELKSASQISKIGGEVYLAKITKDLPLPDNITAYAKIIKEKSVLRKIACYYSELLQNLETAKADNIIQDSVLFMQKIIKDTAKDNFKTPKQLAHDFEAGFSERVNTGSACQGLSTGFGKIDDLIGGLIEGDFVVIGAPTKTGKTGFALDLVKNICLDNDKRRPCFYISLEMNEYQILMRLLSKISKQPLGRIYCANYKGDIENLKKVTDALAKYSLSNIYIAFPANISLAKICADIRRMKAEHDIKLVFIDYLQLISNTMQGRKRYEEIASVSRTLKNIANELDIIVVANAQLDSKTHDGGQFKFNSIRECKSVEHDCDTLIFINRENWQDFYGINRAQIIIRGTRHGQPGVVELAFDSDTVSFLEPTLEDRNRWAKADNDKRNK